MELPTKAFVQIVINPETENGVVTWLEKVTEDEYKSGIASAVLFLCSDAARMIVGHNLVMDGGFTI